MLLRSDHTAKRRLQFNLTGDRVAALGFFCLSCFQVLIFHGPDLYLAVLNVKE